MNDSEGRSRKRDCDLQHYNTLDIGYLILSSFYERQKSNVKKKQKLSQISPYLLKYITQIISFDHNCTFIIFLNIKNLKFTQKNF